MNVDMCKCGELWEEPCKCPEEILCRFSETLDTQMFNFETFRKWFEEEFGMYNSTLGNKVLNLEGVDEAGVDSYKTPYEI